MKQNFSWREKRVQEMLKRVGNSAKIKGLVENGENASTIGSLIE